MPIYEYTCPECKLKFEMLRPISQAKAEATCPHCHCQAKRVLSPFAALTKSGDGEVAPVAGSSACAGCSSTDCDTCHL